MVYCGINTFLLPRVYKVVSKTQAGKFYLQAEICSDEQIVIQVAIFSSGLGPD